MNLFLFRVLRKWWQHGQPSTEWQGIEKNRHPLGVPPLERHSDLGEDVLSLTTLTLSDCEDVKIGPIAFRHAPHTPDVTFGS